MVDEAVERYINRVYDCKAKKVGSHKSMIRAQRREKTGKRYILGIFPVNEYDEWEEYLTDWDYITLEQYSGIVRIPDTRIAVCIDDYNDVVYWRYA